MDIDLSHVYRIELLTWLHNACQLQPQQTRQSSLPRSDDSPDPHFQLVVCYLLQISKNKFVVVFDCVSTRLRQIIHPGVVLNKHK